MESNIPRTGRIGRFANITEKEVDQAVFLRIMQDSEHFASYKADVLEVYPIDAMYSSPYTCARQTVEPLAERYV